MERTTPLGFIGIGNMGRHMARHLLEAGYPLTLHDLRKDAAHALLQAGAKWAESIEELAKGLSQAVPQATVRTIQPKLWE